MPSTLDSYYGYGNTYQVGDVLVAATAYPLPKTDESSSSQGVGAVTLVGVNPDDGSPLWKTRIGGVIGQCSQQNESTIIACWGDRRMIFVDTATGTLMSDLGTDFDLNGATIAGDTVYTSGERMDGTVRTRILASGTTTDLTANFVRTFEPSEKFGAVYTVPHTDTVIAMEQGDGGDPQYRYRIYDLDSGAERFRFEGDSLVPAGNGLFLTSVGGRSGYVGTQNLLASNGSTIRAIPIPSYSSSSYPSKSSTGLPMFLGDGAYDPNSGDELWRSSQIVNTATAGTGSAIARGGRKNNPGHVSRDAHNLGSRHREWPTVVANALARRVLGSKRCDRWRPLRLQRLHRHARDPGSRRKDDVVGPPSAGGRSARSRRLECRQKRVVLLAKSLHRLAIGRQHHRFSVVLTSRLSNQQMDRRTASMATIQSGAFVQFRGNDLEQLHVSPRLRLRKDQTRPCGEGVHTNRTDSGI